MTEFFARVNIRYMYFYGWSRHRPQGIVQGDAGVGIGASVEDNAVSLEATGVNAVDEVAFVVTLEIIQLHVGELCPQFFQIVIEAARAIDTWFTTT